MFQMSISQNAMQDAILQCSFVKLIEFIEWCWIDDVEGYEFEMVFSDESLEHWIR